MHVHFLRPAAPSAMFGRQVCTVPSIMLTAGTALVSPPPLNGGATTKLRQMLNTLPVIDESWLREPVLLRHYYELLI
jgi:hypothetical protein